MPALAIRRCARIVGDSLDSIVGGRPMDCGMLAYVRLLVRDTQAGRGTPPASPERHHSGLNVLSPFVRGARSRTEARNE